METPAAVSVPRAPDTPSYRQGVGKRHGQRGPSLRGHVAVCRRSDGTPVGGSSSVARRAVRRAAVDMRYEYGNDDGRLQQGKGSARALHPAAGPALYKTGPVDCHRVPTSAPPGRKDGFYLHHDVEDVCRSDRRAAGVGEESAQGARSCDLEGNRAGLGCLEHLRNALSFAVVTEWPVGV